MDPNALKRRMMERLLSIGQHQTNQEETDNLYLLAQEALDMHAWLKSGGFRPTVTFNVEELKPPLV